MFRSLGILLLCSALCNSEPVCSRFHYEEQTLKKMITVELLVEKFKTELEVMARTVNDAINELENEREVSKRELGELQTSVKEAMESNAKKINEFTDSLEEKVLFSARGIKNLSPGQGETLVFGTGIVNKGTGYDNTTGVFTAPVGGLFMFTLQLCLNNMKYVYIEIIADNVPLLRSVKIDDYSKWSGCYTASVPAFLNAGGQVWVKTGSIEKNALWESVSQNWNMFSGVLIHK